MTTLNNSMLLRESHSFIVYISLTFETRKLLEQYLEVTSCLILIQYDTKERRTITRLQD